MTMLHQLKDTSRDKRSFKRIGRGPGSGRGKTSSRGSKGAGSRSGYKRRYGYEGGQKRLYTKLPVRGFTRGRFIKNDLAIDLYLIERFFEDGETVNHQTLIEKKLAPKHLPGGIKLLSNGNITKKVTIEVNKLSKGAEQKLNEKNISFKRVG